MTDKTVFQCYLCKLITEDQSKINVHMKLAHNIKVDEDSQILEKFVCPQCKFKTGNMADLKKHMMTEHQKDEWNWNLEVTSVISCEECEIEFPQKAMLRQHIQSDHTEVSNAITQDPVLNIDEKDPNCKNIMNLAETKSIQKIIPDDEFLTKNTKDLELMLKALPKETFYSSEEEFKIDFEDILNREDDKTEVKPGKKF